MNRIRRVVPGLIPHVSGYRIESAGTNGRDAISFCPAQWLALGSVAFPASHGGASALHPLQEAWNAGYRMQLQEQMQVGPYDSELEDARPFLERHGRQERLEEISGTLIYDWLAVTSGPDHVNV